MGKTKLAPLFVHVQPLRAKQLTALSRQTRITRSALVREAVDLLLAKYGKLGRRPKKKVSRT